MTVFLAFLKENTYGRCASVYVVITIFIFERSFVDVFGKGFHILGKDHAENLKPRPSLTPHVL
jgi:hypothetical protein